MPLIASEEPSPGMVRALGKAFSAAVPSSLDALFDRAVRRSGLTGCADHDAPGGFLPEAPAAARTGLRPPTPAAAPERASVPIPERVLRRAGLRALGLEALAVAALGSAAWLGPTVLGTLSLSGAALLAGAGAAVLGFGVARYKKAASAAPLALRADPATGRLPRTARPERYDLRVTVDPDKARFAGSAVITVELDAPVSELTLHALGLSFVAAGVDGKALPLDALSADAAAETVTLRFGEPLSAGRHRLELAWTGELGRHMKGFYLSSAEHEGRTESYAFTHFEPTDARRMFPAFDEPEFKAVFRLALSGPERLTLLSNMPAVSESVKGGLKTVEFAETPRMSTYLLAAAAGRLSGKSREVDGVKVTVWTRPSESAQADFALEAAEASLTRLNAYFGVKYQLPKMDLVAVPDFAAGAMENWGVIFFRDSALLVDPKLSSTRAQRRVAEVVAHEIVHQWFGNLVTMRWWNDLWLNEAFATWLAYKIVDQWKPEWNTWLAFDARRQGPLVIDSLSATRPVRSQAVSSAEIRAMFDGLTYTKGGTILRMLEAYIGEEAFIAGVRLYMRRHAYGNTEADDLWAALEEASGKPVGRIARDWLTQPGYPIVKVEPLSTDNSRLRLTQSRFTADGRTEPGRWAVPVVLSYEAAGAVKTKAVLLDGPETTVDLGEPAAWVHPNQGEKGFFRFGLRDGLLDALVGARSLEGVERTGLLSNLWAEAQAGTAPVERFLDALLRFKDAPERPLVEKTAEALIELQDGALAPEDAERFARLAEDLVGGRWRALGWDGLAEDESRLARAAALAAYGRATTALDEEVARRADAVLSDPASVDSTLVSPLLTLAARRGGRGLYEAYKRALDGAATPEQRDQFLKGLASFPDPALARETLTMTLSDSVRAQDMWKPWLFLLRGTATQRAAWDFLKGNWAAIRAKAGPRGAAVLIEGLGAVRDEAVRAEAEAFFADPANMEPTARRALAQSLETMAIGARFEARARPAFQLWLRSRYP